MVRLLAERFETKSNVKLGGFQSQLQASYVSSHTEELWYNKTVCLWMTIYIYIYIYIYILRIKFLFNDLNQEYFVKQINILQIQRKQILKYLLLQFIRSAISSGGIF